MGFGFGFDTTFGFAQVFIFAVFAIVIVSFIAAAVKGIGTWHKNNNSPRLTVNASVVSKRQNTTVHHHRGSNTGGMHNRSSTTYYATFQFDSGDRLELCISGGNTACWPRAMWGADISGYPLSGLRPPRHRRARIRAADPFHGEEKLGSGAVKGWGIYDILEMLALCGVYPAAALLCRRLRGIPEGRRPTGAAAGNRGYACGAGYPRCSCTGAGTGTGGGRTGGCVYLPSRRLCRPPLRHGEQFHRTGDLRFYPAPAALWHIEKSWHRRRKCWLSGTWR